MVLTIFTTLPPFNVTKKVDGSLSGVLQNCTDSIVDAVHYKPDTSRKTNMEWHGEIEYPDLLRVKIKRWQEICLSLKYLTIQQEIVEMTELLAYM